MNRHFGHVIPPMVSNTPWLFSKKIKRAHYRNALVMIGFHVFITSTFPLAVPLEWNVLFMYLIAFLFLGYPAHDGFNLAHISPGLLVLTLVGLLFFPVLGNLRPHPVSFLPSMRQYAGNWASTIWAFAPGCEEKRNEHIVKPALMQQLTPVYGENQAEVVQHQLLGWRSTHSQGRALNSMMMNQLSGDIDTYTYTLREGEFTVVWIESEAILSGRRKYWVMDVAIGIVERGDYAVADAVEEQPWLPNGPIKVNVTWRLAGYDRVRHPAAARAAVLPGEPSPSIA